METMSTEALENMSTSELRDLSISLNREMVAARRAGDMERYIAAHDYNEAVDQAMYNVRKAIDDARRARELAHYNTYYKHINY